jgi:hypothetical protein
VWSRLRNWPGSRLRGRLASLAIIVIIAIALSGFSRATLALAGLDRATLALDAAVVIVIVVVTLTNRGRLWRRLRSRLGGGHWCTIFSFVLSRKGPTAKWLIFSVGVAAFAVVAGRLGRLLLGRQRKQASNNA